MKISYSFKLFQAFFICTTLLIPFYESKAAPLTPLTQKQIITRLNEWDLLTAPSGNNYPALRYANFLKDPHKWPLEKRIAWRYEHALAQETDEKTLKELCPSRPLTQLNSFINCQKFLPYPIENAKTLWIKNIVTENDEERFLEIYARNLTEEEQWERFETLLSIHNKAAIKRQIPRLNFEKQALATALFQAKFYPKNSLDTFEQLPDTLKTNPTLLIAQFHAVRSNKTLSDSIDFWKAYDSYFVHTSPHNQNLWLSERLSLARMILFQDGAHISENEKEALIKLTQIPHNSPQNLLEQDAILLQSYCLILYHAQPQQALDSLTPLLSSSILSRKAEALFLSAEAEKSRHNEEKYDYFIKEATHIPTSFYGQFSLALLTHSPFLTSDKRSPVFITQLKERLAQTPSLPTLNSPRTDLTQAAHILANRGDTAHATLFLCYLIGQTSDNAQLAAIDKLARQLSLPKVSILIGRKLALKGDILYPDAYPPPYDKRLFPYSSNILPDGLFNALIRQESSADPDAVSPAHAIGLTQILLDTAIETARKHHRSFPQPLDTTTLANPSTNLTVGQDFLEDLYQRFNGNILLTLAAYNAGPHRAQSWGFPINMPIETSNISESALREKEMQVLHWLMTLPFSETRTYIHHILTDMTLYALQ